MLDNLRLFWKKNSKKVIIAVSCFCAVLLVGVIVANAQKLRATFDPSAYAGNEDGNDNNVDYDSSVFGADQSTDDSGLSMDEQAEEDRRLSDGTTDILNNNKDNQAGLQIADGSGTGTGTNNGNAVSASNDGTGTVINGSGTGSGNGTGNGSGTGDGGNGGSGNGGTGDNGGSGGGTVDPSNGGKVQPVSDPTSNGGGINEGGYTPDKVLSLTVKMKDTLPTYYVGQSVTLSELKLYIDSIAIAIQRGKTGETEIVTDMNTKGFGFENPSPTTTTDQVIDGAQASADGTFTLMYYQSGSAMSNNTVTVSYHVKDYQVVLNHYSNNQKATSIFVEKNDPNEELTPFDLTTYYQEELKAIQEDKNPDYFTGTYLKQIFCGWYARGTASSGYSNQSWTLKSTDTNHSTTLIALSKELEDPTHYQVELRKDQEEYQQVLVGYTGSDATLKVPDGVTKIDMDESKTNDAVTKIIIPTSVHAIDGNSISNAFPNCSAYEMEKQASTENAYQVIDGILYSADGKTLISVPVNHANTIDLTTSGLSGTIAIAQDAFAGFEKKEDVQIKLPQDLFINEGWDNVRPSNAKVIVPHADDTNVTYLRYMSLFVEQSLNQLTLTTDRETDHLENRYTFDQTSDCIWEGTTLVYVSPSIGTTYSIPEKDDSVISATAFIDTTDLSSLTIAKTVAQIQQNAFAHMQNLSVVTLESDSQLNSVGCLYETVDQVNSKLKVYLKGINEDTDSYNMWVEALSVYGTDAASHVVATSADAEFVTNSVDGAYYQKVSDGEYVLQSVPDTAKSYDTNPEGIHVTGIGTGAFKNCNNLKLIILPDSVVTIDANAFEGCNQLEVLYYPVAAEESFTDQNQVEALPNVKLVANTSEAVADNNDSNVFYSNDKDATTLLAVVSGFEGELTLQNGTTTIGSRAMAECSGLKSVNSPKGKLSTIEASAFSNCTALTSLPKDENGDLITSCTSIGDEAFSGCTGLLSVTLRSNNHMVLGNRVFAGCSNLTEAAFGTDTSDSFQTTGTNTFADCAKLSTISFQGNIDVIGAYSFANCEAVRNVLISTAGYESITEIADGAFENCKVVEWFAFSTFTKLQRIGDLAFYNCAKVKNAVFSESLEEIGEKAFAQEGLSLTTFNAVTFNGHSKLCKIGAQAFENNKSITTVSWINLSAGNQLEIGDSAFENCIKLSYVYWGTNTIQTIGSQAFAGCKALLDADLSNQNEITTIGSQAFAGCSNITVANFASELLSNVSENVFGTYITTNEDTKQPETLYCDQLTNITLGASVQSIDAGAFSGATKLSTLTLQSSAVIAIDSTAFYQEDGSVITELLTVEVPKEAYESYIQNDSWRQALSYDSLSYPKDITYVEEGADRDYAGGQYVTHADGTYTLVKMSESKTNGVSLLNNTTEIADGAFKNCTGITSVVMPATTTIIGRDIFEGCTSLEAVVFESLSGVTISNSLFGTTTENERFRIYIVNGTDEATNKTTAVIYSSIPELEAYTQGYSDGEDSKITGSRIICTGDNWWLDAGSGALFARYRSSSSAATSGGYVIQMMYLPRSYNNVFTTIPGTTYIYQEAMLDCQLTSFASYSSSLISVGARAFKNCTKLASVDLKSYFDQSLLDEIGEEAFMNCSSLNQWRLSTDKTPTTKVEIDRVSKMGTGVFKNCTKIAQAVWNSKNLTAIPDSTFEGCSAFLQMAASTSVANADAEYQIHSIGKRCFAGCTKFTTAGGSLTSNGSLESIGEECYEGCSAMTLLTLPKSVTSIGKNALSGCSALSVVAFNEETPLSAEMLKDAGLADVWSNLQIYVLKGSKETCETAWASLGEPKTMKDPCVGYRALSGLIYGCENPAATSYGANGTPGLYFVSAPNLNLATVSLYNNANYQVTEIADNAMIGNTAVTTFSGSDFIERVGENAFKGCTNLTTFKNQVYYPAVHTLSIENSAFEDCTSLDVVYLRNTIKIGDDAFKNCTSLSAIGYEMTNSNIETTTIGAHAFSGCSNLDSFGLDSSTTSIGDYAFDGAGSNVADGFELDATDIIDPSACTLGSHIFGETIPENITITTDASYTSKFVRTWGNQLREEYDLTDEDLLRIFSGSTQAMIDGISEESIAPASEEPTTDETIDGIEDATQAPSDETTDSTSDIIDTTDGTTDSEEGTDSTDNGSTGDVITPVDPSAGGDAGADSGTDTGGGDSAPDPSSTEGQSTDAQNIDAQQLTPDTE